MDFITKHMLSAQAAMENQKKGKSGQLVDPRPQTVDGEIKIVITPQLVHDIFEEYPVVGKAYSENVPSKVWPYRPVTQQESLPFRMIAHLGRVLETILRVKAFPCEPRIYQVFRHPTRRKGGPNLRSVSCERR
jgi:hypothetical protein